MNFHTIMIIIFLRVHCIHTAWNAKLDSFIPPYGNQLNHAISLAKANILTLQIALLISQTNNLGSFEPHPLTIINTW